MSNSKNKEKYWNSNKIFMKMIVLVSIALSSHEKIMSKIFYTSLNFILLISQKYKI